MLWFCFMVPVNVCGLVLLAYQTGQPDCYWKDTVSKHAPKVNSLYMDASGSYRRIGYWILFLYQVEYGLMYWWIRSASGWLLPALALFSVPWALEVVHMCCILIAMARAFVE